MSYPSSKSARPIFNTYPKCTHLSPSSLLLPPLPGRMVPRLQTGLPAFLSPTPSHPPMGSRVHKRLKHICSLPCFLLQCISWTPCGVPSSPWGFLLQHVPSHSCHTALSVSSPPALCTFALADSSALSTLLTWMPPSHPLVPSSMVTSSKRPPQISKAHLSDILYYDF